jgi:hypothetical protein
MSVNATLMLALGAASCVMTFLLGRYFASMTPERAAEIWKDKPAAQSEAKLMGKILIFSAPAIFAVLLFVALSGMVE